MVNESGGLPAGVSSGASQPADERRRNRRTRTLKLGHIICPEGQQFDCTVLDISDGGAKVRLGENTACPAHFTLRLKDGRSHRCELAWRSNSELGVRFLSRELAKILIVDDDEAILALYSEELAKHFEIKCASSAQAGLALLDRDGPFTAVISDMRMPEMNGAEFLGHVAERAPDTMRMVLTGYTDLDSAMQAINAGHVYRFISKPVPLYDLVDSIQDAVRQYHRQGAVRAAKVTAAR